MNSLGVVLVLALAITLASAAYPQPTLQRYNLTLTTGNHSFSFQGLTKIKFTVNGYNYSYTNLTTYDCPNNYTKQVALDFSLASVRNISIEWDYKWIDYPEFLIYRPKLVVNSFSIIPIFDYNNQRYRDERNYPQEIDLNQYDLNKKNRPVDNTRYDLDNQRYDLENQRYDLENQRYDLENQRYNPNNKVNKLNHHVNHRPHDVHGSNNRLNNGAYQLGHYHRERIHKFCPQVNNDGIEARNETILVRCY